MYAPAQHGETAEGVLAEFGAARAAFEQAVVRIANDSFTPYDPAPGTLQ